MEDKAIVNKEKFSFLEIGIFRILELITNANIARLMVMSGAYIVFLKSPSGYSEVALLVTVLLSIFGVINNFIHCRHSKKLDEKPGYYAKLEKKINLSLSKLEYFIPLLVNSFTEFNAISTSLIVSGTIIIYSQEAKNKALYANKIAAVKEIIKQEERYIEDDLPDGKLQNSDKLELYLLCKELIWEFILSLNPWAEKSAEDSVILTKKLLKIRLITISITLFGAMHHQLMKHEDKIFYHDNLKAILNSLEEYAMPENISYLILILLLSVSGASVAVFSTNEAIKKYNYVYGQTSNNEFNNPGNKKEDKFLKAVHKEIDITNIKNKIATEFKSDKDSQSPKSFVKIEQKHNENEAGELLGEESLRSSADKIENNLHNEISEISKELKTEKVSDKPIDTEAKVNALAKKKEIIPQRYIQR